MRLIRSGKLHTVFEITTRAYLFLGRLRASVGSRGLSAGTLYVNDGIDLPILLRYERKESRSPESLLRFPVKTPSGQSLPLRNAAHLERDRGQDLVTRRDQTPTLEISAFATGRALSFILKDVEQSLVDLPLPVGYDLRLSGEKDDMNDARAQLLAALAVSLLAVYLLLGAQLRSFLHPLTILISVPLSLSGVGLALKITDKPVSMPVMIGLILLVGTVVNNAIILIDFIRTRREEGGRENKYARASADVFWRVCANALLSAQR